MYKNLGEKGFIKRSFRMKRSFILTIFQMLKVKKTMRCLQLTSPYHLKIMKERQGLLIVQYILLQKH